MTNAITQTFIPGPRLIDGSDLNTLVSQLNQQFALLGSYASITALTTGGAGTITAAGITGQFTSRGGAQAGVAFTDTTDTAAAIIALLPATAPTGASFVWLYQNNTDATATLAGGASVTLAGNTVVPLLTWAMYLVVKTSSTAVSITYVGGGQNIPQQQAKISTETSLTTLTVGGLVNAQLAVVNLGAGITSCVFPKAADLIAATSNVAVGMSSMLMLRNTKAATTTQIGSLVGTTVTGLTQIQPNSAVTALVTIPSLSSVQITGLTSTQIGS